MPINRRLTFNFRLWTNQKNALVGISSAMADVGDVVFTTVKDYKISYTSSRLDSLDRLTVETSFIYGFAISQTLPVKIGLSILSLRSSNCLGETYVISKGFQLPSQVLLSLLSDPLIEIFSTKFPIRHIVMQHMPH